MPRRTKAQALATREHLLDTAERVFEKRGVSRTTLDDIATAAGLTRGAIYGHFKNKGQLVADMFNRIHLPMDRLFAKVADDQNDPIGHLRELFVLMLKDVSSKRQDQRVLHIMHHKCELTEEMSSIQARYRTMGRKAGVRIRTIMQHAIELGQLPASLNMAHAETMFQAILMGLIHNWTLTPRAFNLNNDAEALVDGYIDMLRFSPALRS